MQLLLIGQVKATLCRDVSRGKYAVDMDPRNAVKPPFSIECDRNHIVFAIERDFAG